MYKKRWDNWTKHFDFGLFDLLSLHIALTLGYLIRFGLENPYTDSDYLNLILVASLIDLVIMIVCNSYKNVLKRGYTREIGETIKHVFLVEAFMMIYLFVAKAGTDYSRIAVGLAATIYLGVSYALRVGWKAVLRHLLPRQGQRSLLVYVPAERAERVLEKVLKNNYEGFKIVGLVISNQDMVGREVYGVPVVANANDVADYVCREWVDEVLICAAVDRSYPHELVADLNAMGIIVHLRMYDFVADSGVKYFTEDIGDMPVLTTGIKFISPAEEIVKRVMDICIGLAGCLVTLLLTVIIGPIIMIKSPGPIFFSQPRVGKNGKVFKMYKFRSMYMDAEERKKELMEQNRVQDGMMFKLEWDPRIIGSKQLPDGTMKKGIGNYIRDWSLDEFPQFFNVLKGDMSFVGTRPPTMDEWEKYSYHHRARLAIKPGVTGMWQTSGRSNITDFEEVVKLDTYYIMNWSLSLDIKLIFKTIAVVLKKDGSM